MAVSEDRWPSVHVEFVPSGNKPKEPADIDAEEFIAVKGFRAKGKRAGEKIASIAFGEPLQKEDAYDLEGLNYPSESPASADDSQDNEDNDGGSARPGDVVEFSLDDDLTLF